MKKLTTIAALLALAATSGYCPPQQPAKAKLVSLGELATSAAPPAGYAASGRPALYRRDNLYEAIDGQATEYISYGCVGLAMLEWTKDKDSAEKIQVEIYDMGAALGAFGVYSRAHTAEQKFANIGEEAAVAEDAVEFARNRFYVRMMGPIGSSETLLTVARSTVARIAPGPKPEELTASLPRKGRMASSERWIPEAAFGMEFLRGVFAARYGLGSEAVELYLAAFSDAAEAQSAFKKFRQAVQARSPQDAKSKHVGFAYKDEWMGQIRVFQIARHIAIVAGNGDPSAVDGLLAEVAKETPVTGTKR
ncbi:hypothetical protein FJY63_12905 [Candidatus Sumerlaeota bacterium]|nr:hypothetical protein [Candidatus Sumerlaeota bacterium]